MIEKESCVCKDCRILAALKDELKEKEEYIIDLEEECENLSEINRLLTIK